MDCTVKGNLPSEIFEDIKKIADNRINFQQLKNKTVFVSDCHGLIAYYIICTLLEGNDFFENNTRVITLAKSREDAEKQFGNLTLRKDFVVEIGESKNFPEIERADFVIYCNCPCEVAEEECSNPEIADTITSGFANVLEYAKESNAESVLLVSSYMVYGEVFSGKNNICENDLGYLDPTDADSAYAQSMRSAETLAVCYAEKFGMNVKIARPCFIKPNASGSSFGVTKVKTKEEIQPALQAAFAESDDVMVEAFMDGIELANGCYKTRNRSVVFPITEVVSQNEFFDYNAKYNGEVTEITPARLSPELTQRVQQLTSAIYDILGCKGIVRVDYIITEGEKINMLEINTTPGMTATSFIPQQVRAAGIDIKDVMTDIIEDQF